MHTSYFIIGFIIIIASMVEKPYVEQHSKKLDQVTLNFFTFEIFKAKRFF